MRSSSPPVSDRRHIYYWKCDRPAAFHGTGGGTLETAKEIRLLDVLGESFPGKPITIRPAGGQGNHLTYRARIGQVEAFVRVEDGPEHDDYMEVESRVMKAVRGCGVAVPQVLAVDSSRSRVPFAWQVLEFIDCPDLNQLNKQGSLNLLQTGRRIGEAIARWQNVQPPGFGPFDPQQLRDNGQLHAFHSSYADYFHLHLERHLDYLTSRGFLRAPEARELAAEIEQHRELLDLPTGCLVHKDLAFWNILGTEDRIASFIDWDDAIAGDPMDDFSLLGCFHDGRVVASALAGYAASRALPTAHRRRFWLHLLRNMIVKAVIRVGAGYFEQTDRFFLIGAGGTGADLKTFTQERLQTALHGLRHDRPIEEL